MGRGKYLLTGATGFLGSAISEGLSPFHDIITLGRSGSNDYVVDLAATIPRLATDVDVVIHNAGKAHVVPRNEKERKAFFDVNVSGTQHLLQGLESAARPPKSIVLISSIAVYGLTRGNLISEQQPLSAADPYGLSKIQAEDLVEQWAKKHKVLFSILRLPLVAGKNPPGNLGAMIRGIRNGFYFSIAGGRARKSMVMADDVASIIPAVARTPGIYNLTDGYHPSFYELEGLISLQAGRKRPVNLPGWVAGTLGFAGDILDNIVPGKAPVTSSKIEKIISTLTFDDQLARQRLGWDPKKVLEAFRIQ